MSERLIEVHARAGAKSRSIVAAGDILKVRTPVAPERGKANEDIVDMLADYFMVPRSAITLIRGQTSPKKIFKITAP